MLNRQCNLQFGPYSLHPPQHPVVGASFEQLAARLSEVLLIVGLGKLLRSSDWASGEAGRTEEQKSRWILKTTPSRWQRTSTSHWCGLTHLLSCMHALANPQREMRMLCKSPSSRNAHKRHRLATAQTGYLRCVLRLLFTWPWPVQPGVGHFNTFSCMARTEQKNHRFRRKKKNTIQTTSCPQTIIRQVFQTRLGLSTDLLFYTIQELLMLQVWTRNNNKTVKSKSKNVAAR